MPIFHCISFSSVSMWDLLRHENSVAVSSKFFLVSSTCSGVGNHTFNVTDFECWFLRRMHALFYYLWGLHISINTHLSFILFLNGFHFIILISFIGLCCISTSGPRRSSSGTSLISLRSLSTTGISSIPTSVE